MQLCLLLLSAVAACHVQAVQLGVSNHCGYPVWIAQTPNPGSSPLSGTIMLNPGQNYQYDVSNNWNQNESFSQELSIFNIYYLHETYVYELNIFKKLQQSYCYVNQ